MATLTALLGQGLDSIWLNPLIRHAHTENRISCEQELDALHSYGYPYA